MTVILSSFFVDSKLMDGFRGSPRFCSWRGNSLSAAVKHCFGHGISLKTWCSNTSHDATSTVAENRIFVKALPWHINGKKGSSLYLREARVLDASDDEYGGVLVNPERLPSNPNTFNSMLRDSLSHWTLKGRKGVWLKLPIEKADLVPVAVKEGFEYHHAEKGYLMLTYWIPRGPSMLPSNASHQVGVGGFVISDKNEVLVVQEKHCAPEFFGLWKIPTGFILESEEIYTGVVREIKEETGIDTEFVEVVAFRHAHNVAFQKSDLFFVCMLRPLSEQIIVDDHEIQAAQWMPLVEFVEQPLILSDRMFKKIVDICLERLNKRYCGLSVHQLVSKFDGRLSSLYFNTVEDPNSNCQAN